MICLSWERIHRKAKTEIFHRDDPVGEFANENANNSYWVKLFTSIGMHRMMTIHVVAVGRTWGTSWRWYKVCSHRRNPVIIDKYRNHIVQRVKVARIRSGPGSQWQGTSLDISYSILSNRCWKKDRVGNTVGVKDAVCLLG